MYYVRKVGSKGRYSVRGMRCLGCRCFQPGAYRHRGATGGGSRNTGHDTLMCMWSAYHGCPADDGYTKEKERERRDEGWRRA